jgi:Zn-finger nucleic acid-binding protein
MASMCNGICNSQFDDYCGMHMEWEECPACKHTWNEAHEDNKLWEMKRMIKSENGLILVDKWDEDQFEKDIKTILVLDYDNLGEDKPIYLELKDVKGEDVVDSICIALSRQQILQLRNSLMAMYQEEA